MDIVTLMRERNSEYLQLVNNAQNEEKNISLELNNLKIEIENTEHLYTAKIDEISRNLNRDIENTINQTEDDIKGTLIALKRKKTAINESEKQRQADITKKYEEIIEELDFRHQKQLKKIKAIYSRQTQDVEEEYQTQLFVLNNSRQVSNELGVINSEISNQEIERQVKFLLDRQSKLRNEIVAELSDYEEVLKTALRFSNNSIGSNPQLISIIRQYYEVTSEIEALRNSHIVVSSDGEAETFYARRKADIDAKYNADKEEIDSWYQQSLQEENKKYEAEKNRILGLQSKELDSNTSVEEMQRSVDAELQKKTAEFDKLSERLVSELKHEAQVKISTLQEEKTKKLEVLLREKDLLTQKLHDIKNKNEAVIGDFLEKTKIEMDAILAIPCDYEIGEKKDLSAINELPEKICIGKFVTKIDDCELSKVLYGTKQIGYNNPVVLDVRNGGNVIINAPTIDENNETLYRVLCGLTVKCLEEFPLGALKVHFVDANQHNWFYKIRNAFLRQDTPLCKQLITNDSRAYSRIETINKHDCESIMLLMGENVQDMFDLYDVDKTHAFHLFVISSGFAELISSGNSETLYTLKNLMGTRGKTCGVRFIVVNDYTEIERIDIKKKQLISEILNQDIIFDCKEDSFLFNNKIVDITCIKEENADCFIEKQCTTMANMLAKKQANIISYEQIGFGETPTDKYSPVLDIPIGMYGTNRFSLPLNCGGSGPQNQGCIILGRARRGKSSVFHSLIINGSMKYSPDDLEFWILDFKAGAAAKLYKTANIPHVSLLSQKNKIGDAFCLLKLLEAEMYRRIDLINEAGEKAGGIVFNSLSSYNKFADSPAYNGEHLGRIVVLMDEAQEMFGEKSNGLVEEDAARRITSLIATITSLGAVAGIHLIIIAQDFEEQGKSYLLRDNFVQKINARITFSLSPEALQNSSFGEEFLALKSNIDALGNGETYARYMNGTQPQKVKMAFCDEQKFQMYFEQIRTRHKKKCNLRIIGDNSPLLLQSTSSVEQLDFDTLLKAPKINQIDGFERYRFIYGEDCYSLNPAEIVVDSNAQSTTVIAGSNIRMSSSVVCSILYGVSKLIQKNIHICKGQGRNTIIDNALSQLSDAKDFNLYKATDIDYMIKELYGEYLRRKKHLEEETFTYEEAPIFTFITDVNSIDKVKTQREIGEMLDYNGVNKNNPNNQVPKQGVIYDISEDDPDEYIDPDDIDSDIFDQLGTDLASVADNEQQMFTEQGHDGYDEILDRIGNRTIANVLEELCSDGNAVNMFFVLTVTDLTNQSLGNIFTDARNQIVFNSAPKNIYFKESSSIINDMLKQTQPEKKEATQSLAVSCIDGNVSKVRPVLH